jgi:hypothetical protein
MRAYCEQKQLAAAGKLNDRPMRSNNERTIRAKCAGDWPTDYSMRDYCEEKQIGALRTLERYVPSGTKPAPSGPTAETLVGKTKEEVKKAIGEPFEIAGFRWQFETDAESIKVYFDDNDKVKEVAPTTTALASIKRRNEPPKPTTPAGENVPRDAVAKCGNGGFIYVATGANTCKSAGGVAQWYKKP